MRTPTLWAALSMISVLAALAPARAAACSCMAITALQAYEGHTVVFEGRVLEVRSAADPSGANVVRFEVVQHWKGVETEAIEVETGTSSAACGIAFEPGTSWLVYANDDAGVLRTGLCGRTQRIEDAAEDLATLGAGVVPVEVGDADEVEGPATREPPARGGCGSCASASRGASGPTWLALAAALFAARRRLQRRAPRTTN
ncbi:MAG: hypothetical protein KF729_34540 [Sandaracinaceae bacterium]|nr:hypothetical protein [Sandaracinaceae bacterium]